MITKLTEEAGEEAEHKAWCDTEMATNKHTRDAKTEEADTLSAEIDFLTVQTSKQHWARFVRGARPFVRGQGPLLCVACDLSPVIKCFLGTLCSRCPTLCSRSGAPFVRYNLDVQVPAHKWGAQVTIWGPQMTIWGPQVPERPPQRPERTLGATFLEFSQTPKAPKWPVTSLPFKWTLSG